MKRYLLTALLVAGCCVGCGQDYRAKQMVEVDAFDGKMDLMWTGSPEHLIDRGVINVHHPFEITGENAVIDVWVILASRDVTALAEGKSRGTILLIHGFGQSKASMLTLADELSGIGYDIVLPDLRRHGRSTADYFTYGAKEKDDLAAVMDRLVTDGTVNENVYAYGRRLGGSVAIGYASVHEKCRGVVALLPHAGPGSVLAGQGDFMLLSRSELEATMEAGAHLADFDLAEADTIQAVRRLKCPLLILTRSDPLQPKAERDGKAIFEAANYPKAMEALDTSGYLLQPSTYIAERIDAFISGRIEGLTTGARRPPAAATTD